MWVPRSVAYRTDLMFPRFDGRVRDGGDYLVVETPANPGYYWGNFLLFRSPPRADDAERWPATFARELGTPPEVPHVSLGWDGDERGEVQPLVDVGYQLIDDQVLAATAVVAPAHPRPDLTLRPLAGDADWARMNELNRAADDSEGSSPGYDRFKQALRDRYRAMVEAGLGTWLGAFLGDRLIGQLGLFFAPPLGRYQSVETHPDHRRQGVCATLFHHAATVGLTRSGIERLIVVAIDDGPAINIYRAVGFTDAGRQYGLYRTPAD
jgi:ribosomal protein S18 acetylase RimI-like enzyme